MSAKEIIYYGPNVEFNKKKLLYIQDVMCLCLGVCAGTLSLESLYGFMLFFAGMIITNIGFIVVCCEGPVQEYFRKPMKEVVFSGMPNVAGYVMMWCLVYALVK